MSDSEITITENDVMETMGLFTKVPSILLRGWVSKNANLVKSFSNQIESYKSKLSPYDLARIEKVMGMPVEELQEILKKAYARTGKKQLKILSDPKAKPFIVINLQEARKILFK
jgi:predicted molibdopterin-dependent oxidoreductase YjgC